MKLPQLKFSSGKIIIAVLAICGFFLFNLARLVYLNFENEKRLDTGQNEVLGLQQTVDGLEQKVQYYQTDGFLEKEARDRLQMVKPNETMVVIPESLQTSLKKSVEEKVSQAAETTSDRKNNLTQWLDLFLGKHEQPLSFAFDF